MKKKSLLIAAIVILLIIIIVVAIIACNSSKESDTVVEEPKTEQTTVNDNSNGTTDTTTNVGLNEVEKIFHPAKSGSYATIKVDSSIKMDDESAWLGLCPLGKDYITEAEADEVDVIYFYADTRVEDTDPYVFACDFETVEDGKYALTVSTSDDENVGYVIIQMAMEKNGDKLTFDYENAVIKERPTK